MSKEYVQYFIESSISMMREMSNIELEVVGDYYPQADNFESLGISTIITFTGKIKGRLLLDMDPKLAVIFSEKVMSEEYGDVKHKMVMATVSEYNNIVAGDAITIMNSKYGLKLRLAPPIVFTGQNPVICIPKIPSNTIDCKTEYGRMRINIAFEEEI